MSGLNDQTKEMILKSIKSKNPKECIGAKNWFHIPEFTRNQVNTYVEDVLTEDELDVQNEISAMFFIGNGNEAFEKAINLAKEGDAEKAMEYYNELHVVSGEINKSKFVRLYESLKDQIDADNKPYKFGKELSKPMQMTLLKQYLESGEIKKAHGFLVNINNGDIRLENEDVKSSSSNAQHVFDQYLDSDNFQMSYTKFYFDISGYKVSKEQALKLLEKDLVKLKEYERIDKISELGDHLSHIDFEPDDVLAYIKNNLNFRSPSKMPVFIDNALYIESLVTDSEIKTSHELDLEAVDIMLQQALDNKDIPLVKGLTKQFYKFSGKAHLNYVVELSRVDSFEMRDIVESCAEIREYDSKYADEFFNEALENIIGEKSEKEKRYDLDKFFFKKVEKSGLTFNPVSIDNCAGHIISRLEDLKKHMTYLGSIRFAEYKEDINLLAAEGKSKVAADYILENAGDFEYILPEIYKVSGDPNLIAQSVFKHGEQNE